MVERGDAEPRGGPPTWSRFSSYTDELLSYAGLSDTYAHAFVNHTVEYVRGRIHTNTAENFWGLLKRALGGTYVSVDPFHLFRYVDEEA